MEGTTAVDVIVRWRLGGATAVGWARPTVFSTAEAAEGRRGNGTADEPDADLFREEPGLGGSGRVVGFPSAMFRVWRPASPTVFSTAEDTECRRGDARQAFEDARYRKMYRTPLISLGNVAYCHSAIDWELHVACVFRLIPRDVAVDGVQVAQ